MSEQQCYWSYLQGGQEANNCWKGVTATNRICILQAFYRCRLITHGAPSMILYSEIQNSLLLKIVPSYLKSHVKSILSHNMQLIKVWPEVKVLVSMGAM